MFRFYLSCSMLHRYISAMWYCVDTSTYYSTIFIDNNNVFINIKLCHINVLFNYVVHFNSFIINFNNFTISYQCFNNDNNNLTSKRNKYSFNNDNNCEKNWFFNQFKYTFRFSNKIKYHHYTHNNHHHSRTNRKPFVDGHVLHLHWCRRARCFVLLCIFHYSIAGDEKGSSSTDNRRHARLARGNRIWIWFSVWLGSICWFECISWFDTRVWWLSFSINIGFIFYMYN